MQQDGKSLREYIPPPNPKNAKHIRAGLSSVVTVVETPVLQNAKCPKEVTKTKTREQLVLYYFSLPEQMKDCEKNKTPTQIQNILIIK